MPARRNATVRLGPLRHSLGFLLRLSQLRSFADFYETLGEIGVRPGEVSILMMIAENPGIRQGVLARALMIKRAHMTKMIQAMEETGLVRRTVPEDDKRSIELWLTEGGEAQMTRVRGPFESHEKRNNERLTAEEEETLKALLRKYLRLSGGPTS